jgi:nitrate/nitrite transport system ATP-binding protein
MQAFLEVDHIDKVYPLKNGGEYVALKHIDLKLRKGEFVSLIGHSGCGKSTLLNIVAGLERATVGGVILEGKEVTQPGPDRMVVFQNYSLLPWLTVRQNIALAVNKVHKHLSKSERRDMVEQQIDLVGLRAAADKKPKLISGGMKQRVSIARALSLRPKLLLLDEPFGALDALTRGNLQEQLMRICQESHVTAMMVTHDVDEALLLSDRIVMMTNGPEAHIGQILEVPIPRPRQRLEVVKHPSYYELRNEMIYFLNQQKRAKKRKAVGLVSEPASSVPVGAGPAAAVARRNLEKINLDIGFLPVLDCAPLVVAKEKGFFAAHGLEAVNLCREPSWQSLVEGMTSQRLDAAEMVAAMPLSLTLGLGGARSVPTITALVLSRNGDAITLSRRLADQGVRSLTSFKELIQRTPDQVFTFGVVHPTSTHNLLLRYWLAAGGIDPDEDVNLTMIPPSEMLANLQDGKIDGYCAGEPWGSRAVQEQVGFVAATDLDIWPGHPEKVLGIREDWVQQYPNTHVALVKALIQACEYCDDRRNREEVLDLLAKPEYIGITAQQMRPGFIDDFDYGLGTEPKHLKRFNQFFVNQSNCPGRAEGLWILTQLARWGLTPFPKNWIEILERVRRVDLYGEAARELGMADIEPDRDPFKLFDGMVFNPDDPVGYLQRFSIHRPLRFEEILVDEPESNRSATAASASL